MQHKKDTVLCECCYCSSQNTLLPDGQTDNTVRIVYSLLTGDSKKLYLRFSARCTLRVNKDYSLVGRNAVWILIGRYFERAGYRHLLGRAIPSTLFQLS